jgi:2-phospho-L-lactate guanylyltransferase
VVVASKAQSCLILPVKTFARAKTRLRTHLSDQARSALARELFLRALSVSLRCPSVALTYVVTNGDDVAELVRLTDTHNRAVVLRDPEPDVSLADLMDWALREAASRGSARALILMADLPAVETCDVEALCSALDDYDCVLVPDRRGHSTNALGLRLPFAGLTAFGQADSLAQHRARAHALGLHASVLANQRIAHDVDLPEDLGPFTGLLGCPGEVADKHQGW